MQKSHNRSFPGLSARRDRARRTIRAQQYQVRQMAASKYVFVAAKTKRIFTPTIPASPEWASANLAKVRFLTPLAKLQANQINCERSELPWIACQLQRVLDGDGPPRQVVNKI
jgi:hypothetical protein